MKKAVASHEFAASVQEEQIQSPTRVRATTSARHHIAVGSRQRAVPEGAPRARLWCLPNEREARVKRESYFRRRGRWKEHDIARMVCVARRAKTSWRQSWLHPMSI